MFFPCLTRLFFNEGGKKWICVQTDGKFFTRQSAEWKTKGENRPKRPKAQMSTGKVLAFIFWDAHGILFTDYLEKGRTINSKYYILSGPSASRSVLCSLHTLKFISYNLILKLKLIL